MRYIALSSNILLMSLLLTASIRLRFSVLNAQTLFCFMSTFFSYGFLLLSTIIGLAALPVSLPGFCYLGTGIFQFNRCICRNVLQDSSQSISNTFPIIFSYHSICSSTLPPDQWHAGVLHIRICNLHCIWLHARGNTV